MTRTIPLILISTLMVLCHPEAMMSQTAHPRQTAPNIILILADDLAESWTDSMPTLLSLLASQGTRFDNFFVNVPQCTPSRASILLGQYSHNHQVLTNRPPDGSFERFRDLGHESSNVAVWLQGAGYRTGLFGQYLNGYPDRDARTYVPPGWSEWYALVRRQYFDYQLNENGVIVSYGTDSTDYETDVLSKKVTDFISDNPAGTPFFIYLAPTAVHAPTTPAPRHEQMFQSALIPQVPSFNEEDVSDKPAWVQSLRVLSERQIENLNERYRDRLRTLMAVDEMIGSIIDTLTATGLLDNTYIFFTADNGFHLGEHRVSSGKSTLYEETVRVPLIVRGPGVSAGHVQPLLAANIDLAPTFLELAGATTMDSIDGRSLAPLLQVAPPSEWRVEVLLEHWSGGSGRRSPNFQALRTTRYLYGEFDTGETEFYDLETDPFEEESIPDSVFPLLRDSLANRLEQMRTCVGEDCFPAGPLGEKSASHVYGSDPSSVPVEKVAERTKTRAYLGQNYPEPFNPSTTITYGLSEDTHVTVSIYNTLGQRVATLVDEFQSAGNKSVLWNGSDDFGRTVASGIYLYRIRAGSFVKARKLMLLK